MNNWLKLASKRHTQPDLLSHPLILDGEQAQGMYASGQRLNPGPLHSAQAELPILGHPTKPPLT